MDAVSMFSSATGTAAPTMMNMASPTVTATTSSTAMATSTSMSMGDGTDCKVSMLLNWTTIDACFLTSFLRISSTFTFLLACLSAFLLVLSLELLRRLQRKYDRYLLSLSYPRDGEYAAPTEMSEKLLDEEGSERMGKERNVMVVLEQLTRGVLHVSQFAVSYCVMLLYMSSNGYIIISILFGALVGFALFTRDTLRPSSSMGVEVKEKDCCG